ncbi:MAG TPA: SprT family zinc-dependent metalloprotease [Steroidobacteraceae bacterium]|nr:SprT family zinc-dependent metalloprotease [Steroidobacteraceae bacterium]
MSLERGAGQLTLWSDGAPAEEWTVRISRRARRLSVRVHLTGRVEIVVPPRTSARSVERFIGRHRDWIDRRRAEARRHARPLEPFPPREIGLAGCGERWCVHLAGGVGAPRAVEAAPQLLSLAGSVADTRELRHALRQWLMARAHATLGRELAGLAADLGFSYQRLSVRRQRTRWGSCSVRGTISLNCCLLFQRPEVLRYLLIHELAHTLHMNHSARFWRCVERHSPDFERLDRELLDGWRRVPSWVFDE